MPVFERGFAPLIEFGFLRIVRGGGEVGAHLTAHPGIDHVHITGAARTFDTIVWGPSAGTGAAATARRRKDGTPQLDKPITAELGGVSPIIVVPGQWSDADLRYHAEHVTTMRLQNSGHNCIAGQVVILSSDWPQREAFLAALRTAYAAAPRRPVWYPHADASLAAAASELSRLRRGPPTSTRAHRPARPRTTTRPALETTEYFAPVLGIVELAGQRSGVPRSRRRPRQRQAHRHPRCERPHRSRSPRLRSATGSSGRSWPSATAASRSTPGPRSSSSRRR